jgi:hypothetical protein
MLRGLFIPLISTLSAEKWGPSLVFCPTKPRLRTLWKPPLRRVVITFMVLDMTMCGEPGSSWKVMGSK